mgnify:CR=1 FL=1
MALQALLSRILLGARMDSAARECLEFIALCAASGRDPREAIERVAPKGGGRTKRLLLEIGRNWQSSSLGHALEKTACFPQELCRLCSRELEPESTAAVLEFYLRQRERRYRLLGDSMESLFIPLWEAFMATFVVLGSWDIVCGQFVSIGKALGLSGEQSLYFHVLNELYALGFIVPIAPFLAFLLLLALLVLPLLVLLRGGSFCSGLLWRFAKPFAFSRRIFLDWAHGDFARHFAFRLRRGASLPEALQTSRAFVSFEALAQDLRELERALDEGKSLESEASSAKVLSRFFFFKLRSGLAEKEPARSMEEFAEFCEASIERVANRVSTVLNPLIVVFTATVVSFLAFSYFGLLQSLLTVSLENL